MTLTPTALQFRDSCIDRLEEFYDLLFPSHRFWRAILDLFGEFPVVSRDHAYAQRRKGIILRAAIRDKIIFNFLSFRTSKFFQT
jgi:hypothetical protein